MNKFNIQNQKLIVIIIKRGYALKVTKFMKKHGATGYTIMYGKGSVEKEIYEKILGIDYVPEKEIILAVLEKDIAHYIINNINKELNFNTTGYGIAFTIDINQCLGISHLNFKEEVHEKQ